MKPKSQARLVPGRQGAPSFDNFVNGCSPATIVVQAWKLGRLCWEEKASKLTTSIIRRLVEQEVVPVENKAYGLPVRHLGYDVALRCQRARLVHSRYVIVEEASRVVALFC